MTSKIYQLTETPIEWGEAAGTGVDQAMDLTGLGTGTGRQGARYDLGAVGTARAMYFNWFGVVQLQVAPVVDTTVDIYLRFWDEDDAHSTNDDVGTGDIAVSAENKLKNLRYLGAIICDEAALDVPFAASNEGDPIWIPQRYVAPVFWNNSGQTTTVDELENRFILQPVVPQAQAT